jgi:hypothetical protein
MSDFKDFAGQTLKWTAIGGVCLGIVAGGAFLLNVATQPLRTAGGVINRTFDADNVIAKYEWFHDAHGQYLARVNQIVSTRQMYTEEKDVAERSRLRIELSAQRQSCRDIVTRYNANATKTNVSIFQGREAPSSLNIQTCE